MEEIMLKGIYSIESIDYEGPEKWITKIYGKYKIYDSKTEKEYLAAQARFIYIDIESAGNDGYDPFYILDIYDSTCPFMALYDSVSPEFNDNLVDAFKDELLSENTFVIDRVEVLPKYRGYNLTKRIISEAIRLFSSDASIAALKSFPLQFEYKHEGHVAKGWEKRMRLDKLEYNEEIARKSLMSYYEKLGFKQIDNEIMARLI